MVTLPPRCLLPGAATTCQAAGVSLSSTSCAAGNNKGPNYNNFVKRKLVYSPASGIFKGTLVRVWGGGEKGLEGPGDAGIR